MNSAITEPIGGPTSFDTHHDDVIHDAKVDFYGRRLATASSDRTIRIFQINENETETLLSILSGHEGPVWQVAWAHPKFGSILASCSYDGSVIIWQEDKQQKLKTPAGTHSTWTKVKVHRVHDSSVNSICFAPHSYGLQLACASSDGKVSVLKKEDEEWSFDIFDAHSAGCNSVSWAPSAIPSSILALDFIALEKKPVPVEPQRLATGGCDNIVKIWRLTEDKKEDESKWKIEASLDGHTDWVRDVCWRPNMGLTDNILVSCGQDNRVLIWKSDSFYKEWSFKPLTAAPFSDVLWRVSFSEYGHLLAVSCGDNTVTLWREKCEDAEWKLVGNVNENVTETAKIEEPLAVEPPPSAPVPDINFTSSAAAYIKPMSPMIPLPSVHASQSSPGYQQYNQAYDDYQNATTPTVPVVEPLTFNNAAEAINDAPQQEFAGIYDNPEHNYYSGYDGSGHDNSELIYNAGYDNQNFNAEYSGADVQEQTFNAAHDLTYDAQYNNEQNYNTGIEGSEQTYEASYNAAYESSQHSESNFNKDVGFISDPVDDNNQVAPNGNYGYSDEYNIQQSSQEVPDSVNYQNQGWRNTDITAPNFGEPVQEWNRISEATEYNSSDNGNQGSYEGVSAGAYDQQAYQQYEETNYDPSQYDGQAQDYSQPSFNQEYYENSEYQEPSAPQDTQHESIQNDYGYEETHKSLENNYTLQYEGYGAPVESNQNYSGL